MNFEVDKLKIAVMVPQEHLSSVREAMFHAGAGIIGNYSHCSVVTPCTGTYFADKSTNPYSSQRDVFEEVQEFKIESVCAPEQLPNVLKAIRDAHPYEEPGIDIYPLLDPQKF